MHKRPYEKLIAWQESYALCKAVYQSTQSFPATERYALASQIRRAAYSVPLNIAEGSARRSRKEKAHFYCIALGSIEELHCALHLGHDLGYIEKSVREKLNDHVHRTSYLITKLRSALFSSETLAASSASTT